MAINLQGSWMLRVKRRNPASAMRFVVSGAEHGNGTYNGVEGQETLVGGSAWSVQAQHRHGRTAWRDSALRWGLPSVMNGRLRVDFCAGHRGSDHDGDDLVLTGSLPVNAFEQVVYGNVRAYAQTALFNPGRDDYLVIDPLNLAAACARHPALREVIEKLHPERVSQVIGGRFSPTPVVIPTGLPTAPVGLVFESQTAVKRVPFQPRMSRSGAAGLSRRERDAIDHVRALALRLRGDTDVVSDLSLRFQAYRCTPAEARDGPYTGTGLREELGCASTDGRGNYLFRYTRSSVERPGLLIQLKESPSRVSFETAPYDQLANLRRIDLCVPRSLAQPERLHRPGDSKASMSQLFEPATAGHRCGREPATPGTVLVHPAQRAA